LAIELDNGMKKLIRGVTLVGEVKELSMVTPLKRFVGGH
jgi:hypothetical protein